ncbi:hypothetical protein LTS10_001602 [Elasticomyces elasticus]|nr:hypothetical protein LTS10_001602 [Elasticomyces elasticus]
MPPQAQYSHVGMTQNPQYSQFGTTSNAQYSQLDLEDAEDVPTHTSPNVYTTDRNTHSLADMVRAMPQVNPTTRRWSPERPPKMLEQSPYTIEGQGEFGYNIHPELYNLQDPNEQRTADAHITPNTTTDYTLNYDQTATFNYHPPQQITAPASPYHESATAPPSSFGSSPASAHLHSQPKLATQGLPRKSRQQRVMCICTICNCTKMYPLRTRSKSVQCPKCLKEHATTDPSSYTPAQHALPPVYQQSSMPTSARGLMGRDYPTPPPQLQGSSQTVTPIGGNMIFFPRSKDASDAQNIDQALSAPSSIGDRDLFQTAQDFDGFQQYAGPAQQKMGRNMKHQTSANNGQSDYPGSDLLSTLDPRLHPAPVMFGDDFAYAAQLQDNETQRYTASTTAGATAEDTADQPGYVDHFADEAAVDAFRMAQANLGRVFLNIPGDDHLNITAAKKHEMCAALHHAMLQKPVGAPDSMTDRDKAAYVKKQNEAYDICKAYVETEQGRKHVSAACDKLYWSVQRLHVDEAIDGAGLGLDRTSKFSVRFQMILDVVGFNKSAARDIPYGEGRVEDLIRAPGPFLRRKAYNVKGNKGKGKDLGNMKELKKLMAKGDGDVLAAIQAMLQEEESAVPVEAADPQTEESAVAGADPGEVSGKGMGKRRITDVDGDDEDSVAVVPDAKRKRKTKSPRSNDVQKNGGYTWG